MEEINELQITGKINQLKNKQEEPIYPISVSKAIYMDDGRTNLHEEIIKINLNNVKYDPVLDTIMYFDGTDWVSLEYLLGGEGGNNGAILKEDLTVTGVDVGNLTSGTTIPSGTTAIEIFKQMLIKVIPPTYKQPTISLNSTVNSAEIGSVISTVLNTVFTKNDSGDILTSLIKDGGTIISEGLSITIPSLELSGDKTYTAIVNYGDGPIKDNNIGQPDSNGQILAGSKTATVTIKAYRPYFGFASSDSTAPTSEYIRSKTISGLNINVNGTIKVVTEPTSRIVCFAYPATLRDCSKIRYDDLNDDNNKTAFTSIILSIPDLSGANPIDFRVYYYIAPIPFGTNATFTLTI